MKSLSLTEGYFQTLTVMRRIFLGIAPSKTVKKRNEVNPYPGWLIFSYIYQVRQDLENQFHRKVDLVDMDALNEVGRKYILSQVKYV
jgi:hypothetical protein